MSSLTLQVTYGRITKKIVCTKSQSVNQATETALEKFLLKPSQFEAKLVYQKKPLDASLPLRFTNLINNSKVELQVKERAQALNLGASASTEGNKVDIKLVVAGLPTRKPQYVVSGIATDLLLSQVLKLFESSNPDLQQALTDTHSHTAELVLFDQKISQSQFETTVLRSVIGSGVRNLVLRLIYTNTEGAGQRELRQQEIVRAQLEQQKLANAKRLEEEAVQREQLKEELKRQKLLENKAKEEHDARLTQSQPPVEPLAHAEPVNIPLENSRMIRRNSRESAHIPSNEETKRIIPAIEANREAEIQLFKPGAHQVSLYDNPDDDYEMTVSQAKQYYKIVQESGRHKQARAPKQISHFSIRLRFPDRSIIQFNYEQSELADLKLGTLLKKIDEVLLPQYLNRYEIKFPTPPFSVLPLTFETNNKLLVDFPEFQSERILLLWELTDNESRKGPFVKEDSIASIKDSSEMAEVVIEENRSYLADDDEGSRPHGSSTNSQTLSRSSAPQEGKSDGKIPRWMKLNRK